jgi:hypothetical protein
MGGEITWVYQNGNYIFTLIFYRDCNGADVNTVSETIQVWNHSTVKSITLPFESRTDISPKCKPVVGSPPQLSCGSGTSVGNGIGAIEKIIYRSAPLALSGTPPKDGWVFTYGNFSRSAAITNISNPSTYGTTITAKMYAIPGLTKSDSSPKFLQEPYFVSCTGIPYVYNMNPVDPDLDSITVSFGIPYNNFSSGTYNPPSNPIPVPFENGFSFSSPTPSAAISPGSIPAQVNPITGELTFTSTLTGNFVVKVLVKSYRYGILIAEVEREMQLVVIACPSSNQKPVLMPPFAGNTSFETTVTAGSLVNFDVISKDLGLLQDGSFQNNLLSASGTMYGTGFSSTIGCNVGPCATLTPTPNISGVQGVNTTFNWQTSCDHLLGADGFSLDMIPYNFVFRIQDDFCNVPQVSYATVTINIVNPGVIEAPKISCIQSNANGDVLIQWSAVSNPTGSFVAYQIYSLEKGLLATLPSIGTTSWTDPSVTQQNNYYLAVVSGCNGQTLRYSDTLANIFLKVTNPSDGTAILTWNDPVTKRTESMGAYYHILREYPKGTWTLLDSLPYGTTAFKDTIDICEALLNYQVVLSSLPCDHKSNMDRGNFTDKLTPYIPLISSVSIDTLSNELLLKWNKNPANDTYGYVIYNFNTAGVLVELDTVWGNANTSYNYATAITQGPLSYTVAAFDSCLTKVVPPTYQTSAKANIHTTVFLKYDLNLCENTITLNWTPYVDWPNDTRYVIYGKSGTGKYTIMGETDATTLSLKALTLDNYCFFVKAISYDGLFTSFSNKVCLNMIAPINPAYHYLMNATVQGSNVVLSHIVDASSGVSAIAFEKENQKGVFEEIARIPVVSDLLFYTDMAVDTKRFSYMYRARLVDSCGNLGAISNTARTILLNIQKDEVRMLTYLNWNPYESWNGSVISYSIYRDTGTGFSNSPLAVLSSTQYSFEDDLTAIEFNGKVCYVVEAIEGNNTFNESKISTSNESCQLFGPIVYVPNAFTPEGLNPLFRPVISLSDPTDYDFTIFDRLGQTIFETNDITVGWNGLLRGTNNFAETGTYLYMIKLRDGAGNELIHRGFVNLLK